MSDVPPLSSPTDPNPLPSWHDMSSDGRAVSVSATFEQVQAEDVYPHKYSDAVETTSVRLNRQMVGINFPLGRLPLSNSFSIGRQEAEVAYNSTYFYYGNYPRELPVRDKNGRVVKDRAGQPKTYTEKKLLGDLELDAHAPVSIVIKDRLTLHLAAPAGIPSFHVADNYRLSLFAGIEASPEYASADIDQAVISPDPTAPSQLQEPIDLKLFEPLFGEKGARLAILDVGAAIMLTRWKLFRPYAEAGAAKASFDLRIKYKKGVREALVAAHVTNPDILNGRISKSRNVANGRVGVISNLSDDLFLDGDLRAMPGDNFMIWAFTVTAGARFDPNAIF